MTPLGTVVVDSTTIGKGTIGIYSIVVVECAGINIVVRITLTVDSTATHIGRIATENAVRDVGFHTAHTRVEVHCTTTVATILLAVVLQQTTVHIAA